MSNRKATASALDVVTRPNCARVNTYIRDEFKGTAITVSVSVMIMTDGLAMDRASLALYFRALADELLQGLTKTQKGER